MPKFDEFGVGRIPAVVVSKFQPDSLAIQRGIISTGDSFAPTREEERFFAVESVSCKEMEAASIASLARDLQVPFLAVKAVTDLVDHPESGEEDFQRNLRVVSEDLSNWLMSFIRGVE